MDWVLYRMGLLACFRSIYLETKYIGCMITASHNPSQDNGCKLVDPMGDMLEEKWESYASLLVNSKYKNTPSIVSDRFNSNQIISSDLQKTLKELYEEFKSKIDWLEREKRQARIVVAHDTRPSCTPLLAAFRSGVERLNGSLLNLGLMSTPQLHYVVRCLNTNGEYGEPTEHGYFRKITRAFFNVWSTVILLFTIVDLIYFIVFLKGTLKKILLIIKLIKF